VVTNADLARRLDTSDEWIRGRTGIRERHIGSTTAALATRAARQALERAGLGPGDVDQLVVCTTTPDLAIPATSSAVQHALGIRAGAFDLNAVCSGCVYGFVVAHGLIALGAERVLLVGAETMSRVVDWSDRSTAILFGDGAGAVVLEAVSGPGEVLAWDLQSRGDLTPLLYADTGDVIKMEGREVYRQAVGLMVDSALRSMEKAGVAGRDLSLVVPHQANSRIIEAACARLDIPLGRVSIVLDRTGNTSAASIPIALADALDGARVEPGGLILLVGFGAGMTAASALLRWSGLADQQVRDRES
jgi:3-oxoacyl-[acyl-carrier-protein] synthase-3